MMTGIPIENNLWTAYLLTIFFVVAGFAVYDVLYRRVPDRALVFFIPLRRMGNPLRNQNGAKTMLFCKILRLQG